jgi:hypothetical protein
MNRQWTLEELNEHLYGLSVFETQASRRRSQDWHLYRSTSLVRFCILTAGVRVENSMLTSMTDSINGVTTPVIGNLDLIRLIQENGGDIKCAF